jgi:hypothetical protein
VEFRRFGALNGNENGLKLTHQRLLQAQLEGGTQMFAGRKRPRYNSVTILGGF